MSFIKSSVTETLCDLLCINELCPFVFLCLPITPPSSFDLSTYGNHLTNTTIWWNQSQQDSEAMQLNKGLSSTLLHGNDDQRILTKWWSGVTDNVAAIGPRIYGIKEEMVSIFHVLINRPIKDDLGNNGDDNRKKLESKNTHNKNTIAFTRNVEFRAE